MPDLPARPDLVQLRHQAKDLLHAARVGNAAALERVHVVSERVSLASAQLALAREYGFASWAKLKTEVVRRQILDDRDVDRLVALLAAVMSGVSSSPGSPSTRAPPESSTFTTASVPGTSRQASRDVS